MNVNEIAKIVEELGQQDLYEIVKHGLPENIRRCLIALAREYRNSNSEDKTAIKSLVNQKDRSVILAFVTGMATEAMQERSVESLDIALVAFDLSDIMRVDFRDAFGHISQLAAASKACGIDLVEHAVAVIPVISPRLMGMLNDPGEARIMRDSKGKPVFWSRWRAVPKT